MKGKFIRYTAKQLAFIKQNRRLPRADLYAAFVKRFRRKDVSFDNIKSLCWRRGWKNGRDGRFPPGSVPANKGKKMPFNANSARTRFRKGNRTGRANQVYKPIGSERLSKEGYLERKIHDGLPFQSRWRAVHLLNWEALNGPVPAGMVLKCLREKVNTDPSNWLLVPRAMLPRLNGRFGRGYDNAPADLKPTIMAIAQLEHSLRKKRTDKAKGVRP